MIMILWCVAILQWLSFIYLPAVALYGVIRMTVHPDVMETIRSPFLGIKKVSIKSGFIIWMIQATLSGVVLYEICQWMRSGISPLIRMW